MTEEEEENHVNDILIITREQPTTQSAGFDNDYQNHLDMMDYNGDQHNNKRK